MKLLTLFLSTLLLLQANKIESVKTYSDVSNQILDYASSGSHKEAIDFINSVSDTLTSDSMRWRLQIRKGQFLILLHEVDGLDSLAEEAHKGFRSIGIDSMAFEVYFKLGTKLAESAYKIKAKEYYTRALQFSETANLAPLRVRALNGAGRMARRVDKDMAKAMEYYFESAALAEKIGDSSGMYYAYGNMANTFSSMKNFEKSLEYNLKVLDLILKLGERRNLTRLYTNIGWTYFNYGDTTNMLKYYTLSAEDAQSRSDTLSMIYSFINLGDLLMDLERFDSSRLLLNKVVELSQKGNSAYLVHLANFEQGKLLFRSGEKEKGLNQLLSAKKGLIENGAKTNDYSDFLVISDAYDDLGLLNQALKNTEEVYKVSDERGSVSIKLHALEKIHDYYLRSGQPRKAYEAIQELLSLRTDLFDETKASIVGGMEAEQRLYKKQEEYELLALEAQAQAEKSRAQRLIFTLSVIILIAVMAVILLFYRQQKIRKKLVESELSVKKEQNKSMANELEYKNRELVNFAVQITQKNEFIELLDDKIKANQGEGLSEVNEVIQANQSISKDREEFEMHVQNVYEGFFIKLNELYPDITPAEKKLAALLRLDLSSKEISTILNISPKSVDMSRYRLRKKMSLEGSSSLTETLQNI